MSTTNGQFNVGVRLGSYNSDIRGELEQYIKPRFKRIFINSTEDGKVYNNYIDPIPCPEHFEKYPQH